MITVMVMGFPQGEYAMTNTLGSYNEIMIKTDQDGYFSLTDMWKANGKKYSQRPHQWMLLPGTINLLKELNKALKARKSSFDLVKTVKGGRMPGTWGLQKIAIAYAEYLSPTFHVWVLDSISTFVAMEEDPEAGLSRYTKKCIKTLQKDGRSDTFIMERIEGIALRNLMDSEARVAGVTNRGMATLSTNINKAVTGLKPWELRKQRNVKRTRDGLSMFELQMVKTIEAAGCDMFKQTADSFNYISDREAVTRFAPLLQQVSALVSTVKE